MKKELKENLEIWFWLLASMSITVGQIAFILGAKSKFQIVIYCLILSASSAGLGFWCFVFVEKIIERLNVNLIVNNNINDFRNKDWLMSIKPNNIDTFIKYV